MPLVLAPSTVTLMTRPADSRERLLEKLDGDDVDERRRAARALSRDPGAVAALAARLDREPEPRVRDALFGALVIIGGERAAELIAPLLRSEDAGLRGGASEALKRLDEDATSTIDSLLADSDSDIRLLAIEVTRAWPSARATPRVGFLLENDPNVNACIAAIDVATEIGTPELLAPLDRVRARFAGEPFLAFAVDIARARINATGASDE